MNCCRFIGRLLAVFVIAGLIFAPLVTPAAAKHSASTKLTDMAAMSGAMPCCPDDQKSNNSQDCPLVALCMLTIAQAEPSSVNDVELSFLTSRLFFFLYDTNADGLVGSPPDHPPRILI